MLPEKTIKLSYSLLGIGGLLLKKMGDEETVSSLWLKAKDNEAVNTYEKYIKGLVLLYTLNAITLEDELLRRRTYVG